LSHPRQELSGLNLLVDTEGFNVDRDYQEGKFVRHDGSPTITWNEAG
jgi:hypothetical protein